MKSKPLPRLQVLASADFFCSSSCQSLSSCYIPVTLICGWCPWSPCSFSPVNLCACCALPEMPLPTLPHPLLFPSKHLLILPNGGSPFPSSRIFHGDLQSFTVTLFCAPVIFIHTTPAMPTTLLCKHGCVSVSSSRLSALRADTGTYLVLSPRLWPIVAV